MGTKTVLKNVRTFVNGTDLTGYENKLEIQGMLEEKPVTNFASQGAVELLGGLGSATIAAEGQWAAGDFTNPDDALMATLGLPGPWTACITTPNAGDLAWQVTALTSKYTLGGAVGDVAPWAAGVTSSSPLVRGQILHPPGTLRSSTGSGTAVLATLMPTANQFLWVNLHVLSVAGTSTPTLTVTVQTDDNSGFTSATTVGTFVAVTAANQSVGQTLKIAGAITDTYLRVGFTISGSSPGFTFVASAGVA